MAEPISKTVAISRQVGSGGSYIGRAVAERLDLRYIDREMLRDAAEYLHTQDPAREEEAVGSWWARLGQTFALGTPDAPYHPPPSDATYEGELFDIQKRIVREVVEGHAGVIVGRGAAQTLRGRVGVVSVFLHAPEAWRVARVREVYALPSESDAQRMVRESDRARARFIRAIAGCEWTDVRGYDLTLDTAALGFDAAIDVIVRAVEARFDRQPLSDLRR
jgi:cytidylate kinase